jgi:hypothetical protein
LGGKDFGWFIFLHNTKSSFGGTQKLYWSGVLEGLYDFFKFNLYGYNTNTIKKYERFQYFPLYFPPSKALPSKLPNKT